MQPELIVIVGVFIVLTALLDVIWSVASTAGGGPLTTRMARVAWASVLRVHRFRPMHRLLQGAGPLLTMLVLFMWVTMLWVGWSLVFTATPDAVVDATTRAPASLADRWYYAGFNLFTLGTGDFVGGSAPWRIVSVFCSFTGLSVITMSLTYILSVVSAATAKRQLALMIHGLGHTTADMVANGWNGEDLSNLDTSLNEIASLMALHSERHLAYPVLHFYHAAQREASLPLAAAALHDALVVLGACVPPQARPNPVLLRSAETAVVTFLDRAGRVDRRDNGGSPPLPDFQRMEAAGVPLLPRDVVERAFDGTAHRRDALCALIVGEGWSWSDVQSRFTRPEVG